MKKIISISLIAVVTSVVFYSCKKGPGPGGKASITGKIRVKNYSGTHNIACNCYPFISEYNGQGEDVYIIYGNEAGVGNRVKTAYDGTFVFDFLRQGKYKVYALSRDTTSPANSQTKEILQDVEIFGKKDEVTMDDIVILK